MVNEDIESSWLMVIQCIYEIRSMLITLLLKVLEQNTCNIISDFIIQNINQINSLVLGEHPFKKRMRNISRESRNSISNFRIKSTIFDSRETDQRLRESDVHLSGLVFSDFLSILRVWVGTKLGDCNSSWSSWKFTTKFLQEILEDYARDDLINRIFIYVLIYLSN